MSIDMRMVVLNELHDKYLDILFFVIVICFLIIMMRLIIDGLNKE